MSAIDRADSNPAGAHDVTAIVLSWKRPRNIPLIVRSLLATPAVSRVIVSNNNPHLALPPLPFASKRLSILRATEEKATTERWRIARDTPSRYYLAVDDDIFLRPEQFELLCTALKHDPSVPHGMFGHYQNPDGSWHYNGERAVPVLNRVYACTAEHVRTFHRIADALGAGEGTAMWRRSDWDDIVLSKSGCGEPRIHDLGPYLDCPTQGLTGIAVWRSKGFFPFREAFQSQLQAWQDAHAAASSAAAIGSKTAIGAVC